MSVNYLPSSLQSLMPVSFNFTVYNARNLSISDLLVKHRRWYRFWVPTSTTIQQYKNAKGELKFQVNKNQAGSTYN